MEPRRNHFLRIYNEDRQVIYEEPFWSASNAQREFNDTVYDLTRDLECGKVLYVTRWEGKFLAESNKVVGNGKVNERKGA